MTYPTKEEIRAIQMKARERGVYDVCPRCGHVPEAGQNKKREPINDPLNGKMERAICPACEHVFVVRTPLPSVTFRSFAQAAANLGPLVRGYHEDQAVISRLCRVRVELDRMLQNYTDPKRRRELSYDQVATELRRVIDVCEGVNGETVTDAMREAYRRVHTAPNPVLKDVSWKPADHED
ncbi:MAG: hypothetical protein JST54_12450 [Deltaproteobacteria bacterium]|nr:hypothetical protein [Deltaproteobacteria bacterium]